MPTFIALAAAAFLSTLVMRMTDPVLPILVTEFAVSPAQIAWLATAYAIPYGLFQLVFGPLGDRFGKLRIVRVCVVGLGVSLIATALAPSYATMLAARFFSGAIGGAIIPLGIAALGDRVALEKRQAALSRFMLAVIAGTFSGGFVTGLLAEALPWRTIFLLYAATTIAIGVSMFALPRAGKTVAVDLSPRGFYERYRAILQKRGAPVLLVLVFFEGALMFGALPYLSIYFHDQRGFSYGTIGAVLACFGLGGVIYSAIVTQAIGRLGPYRLFAIMAIVAGLANAALALALPTQLYAVAWAAAGLGFYGAHNVLQVRGTELAPEARGSSIASFAFSFFIGQAFGPILVGWLIVLVALPAAFGVVGALLIVFAILGALAIRAVEAPREPTA